MTHKFKYAGREYDRKVYLVSCSKKKGKFSTALWNKGKVVPNKCPCCEEVVPKK